MKKAVFSAICLALCATTVMARSSSYNIPKESSFSNVVSFFNEGAEIKGCFLTKNKADRSGNMTWISINLNSITEVSYVSGRVLIVYVDGNGRSIFDYNSLPNEALRFREFYQEQTHVCSFLKPMN